MSTNGPSSAYQLQPKSQVLDFTSQPGEFSADSLSDRSGLQQAIFRLRNSNPWSCMSPKQEGRAAATVSALGSVTRMDRGPGQELSHNSEIGGGRLATPRDPHGPF